MSKANYTTEVAILGAGPVGLTIANYLSKQGVQVTVVEQLDSLIDYPRAIGIDDESLRTIQSLGLVDQVLPHTTPNHAMRFLTPKGRCFADIQPLTREFGFSRRNAFIQPQVDNVLLQGLKKYKKTEVLFSRHLTHFSQDADSVTLNVQTKDGGSEVVRAQYLIACDGSNSYVRRTLNIPFEDETAPNQWIVIDIDNDPLATPHIYLCCDPVRPYVSAALPHGIRRFEFMVMLGETQEDSPVGKMFIQPQVKLESGETVLLDEVIGNDFAIIAWGVDPKWGLSKESMQQWKKLGVKFIQVIPAVQLSNQQRKQYEDVITIGDIGTDIHTWFGKTQDSIVILRPDRFVAALAIPQSMESTSKALFNKLHVK